MNIIALPKKWHRKMLRQIFIFQIFTVALYITNSAIYASETIVNQPKNNSPSTSLVKNSSATPENPATVANYSAFKKFLSDSKGIVSLNVGKYTEPANVFEPIRLDESVALALKNNLEIKASQSRVKSAQLEKITAYSRLAPSLDLRLDKGKENSAPAAYNDSLGNRVLNDDHQRTDRTLALRQPIIDLEVVADILTSDDKENLARIQDRDERDTIAYETLNVYLKLLQSRITIYLADQYCDYLNNLSKHMKDRFDGGIATVGELERIKGNANFAEVAKDEAIGEYESNLAEFRRLTQVTPAQLQVIDVAIPDIPKSVSIAITQAIENNPSYLASQAQVDIASSTLDSSYAKVIPKVSLEYSDTRSYDAGGAAKGNPVDGAYPTQEDKRLLLVAHWALNGGIELVGSMTAREKEQEARFRSIDSRLRIEEGIRASYNAFNAANNRITTLQKGIESNEKVVREFEDQYKNGNRSMFELLDSYSQLYNNRVSLMKIEIARILAAYQIRRQMGDLLPALVKQEHSEVK